MGDVSHTKAKKRRPLSEKGRKALALIKKNPHGSLLEVSRKVGYKDHSSIYRLVKRQNPEVVKARESWLKHIDKEIPVSEPIRVLKEGLSAMKVISATVVVTSTDPDANETRASGKTNDFIEVPDHQVRGQFFDRYVKVKNLLGETSETEKLGQAEGPVNINADKVMIVYGDPNNPNIKPTILSPLRTSPYDPSA